MKRMLAMTMMFALSYGCAARQPNFPQPPIPDAPVSSVACRSAGTFLVPVVTTNSHDEPVLLVFCTHQKDYTAHMVEPPPEIIAAERARLGLDDDGI